MKFYVTVGHIQTIFKCFLVLKYLDLEKSDGMGGIHCFEETTRRDNYWLRQAGHRHENDRIRFEIVRTILMMKMLMMMMIMRIVVMMVILAVINQCSRLANKLINFNLQRAINTKGHLT